MQFSIDRNSPVPAYYQIQLDLSDRIQRGEWNEAGSCIIVGSSERSNLLLSLQERMEWDLKRQDREPERDKEVERG